MYLSRVLANRQRMFRRSYGLSGVRKQVCDTLWSYVDTVFTICTTFAEAVQLFRNVTGIDRESLWIAALLALLSSRVRSSQPTLQPLARGQWHIGIDSKPSLQSSIDIVSIFSQPFQ